MAEEKEEHAVIRYIRGLELLSSDCESARTYYHYACDELGSVTHVTDEAGAVLNRYTYDAFGNRTSAEETVGNRFGFTGELLDGLTGQYYLRARFYSPAIGRFLQEDTYYGDGLNLYSYCQNNPVKYVDPSGHNGCPKEGLMEGKNRSEPEQPGSGSNGSSEPRIKGGKSPNGYKVGDIDEHGLLSPGKNRADGNHNTASEGRVQSHHIIQDKWAKTNISGYQRNNAPAILLETGTGKPHTYITNSQRARRAELGYNTSIRSEFYNSYTDLINSGVSKRNAQKAIKDAYKYFDGLGAFD